MWSMMRVLMIAFAACGCTSGAIECAFACERYDDCVGGQFDESSCIDRCEEAADRSDAFEEQVAVCNECLDELECSPTCNQVCADTIPPL